MRPDSQRFTRRSLLQVAAGVGFGGFSLPVLAFGPDFWNKKEPSDWTGAEIDQLTNKSPWAKEVTAGGGQGSGMGRGGGISGGIPGIGGMGGGRRSRGGGGMPSQSFKGLVRWESAKPILDALKTPIPEAFANHYVISVGGIPLDGGSRGRYQSGEDDNSADALNRLKGQTYLEPKEKRDVQPGIVQQPSSGYGNILFGFSKEILTLRPEDKEVTFISQFGRIPVKVKFNLKDMLYRGELAV